MIPTRSLAALALTALPWACQAQTQVTLYGVVDAAIESIKSGTNKDRRVQSGGLYQSRWGLRGSEDLGGGLRALFNIESRFNVDDGTQFQGLAWGGRAVVGLAGPWGQVVLGREYVPLYDIKVYSNPFGVDPYSAPQVILRGGSSRSNNAVRYDTPSWSGLSVATMYSVGDEDPANPRAGRHTGLAVQYRAGGLWLGAGANRVDVRSAAVVKSLETIAGVRYRWAAATVYGNYWRLDTDNAAGDGDVGVWTIGATYDVSANGRLLGSVSGRNTRAPSAAAANDANQAVVGFEYGLSKRTTLYTQYVRVENKARSAITVSGYANTGTAEVSDPRAFQVGVRHTF